MTAHPTIPTSTARPTAGDRCPWCDQSISHQRFEAITAKIAAEERERSVRIKRELAAQFAKDREQLIKEADDRLVKGRAEERAASEKAASAKVANALKAKAEAERRVTTLQTKQQTELNDRLRQQREALEKDKVVALNAQEAKAFKERQKLELKVEDLKRQVQNKTAGELGEGAELDLFEGLKAEFPGDLVRRVGKGIAGADIVHEFVHNGRPCGSIVVDSKNRAVWRNEYVNKLREDQLAAQADHAILSTRKFPEGADQIYEQGGVIIANPARVVAIVHILRQSAVQLAGVRLSSEARNDKAGRLYEFITSAGCSQLLDQIDRRSDDLLGLEVREAKQHQATWKHRGLLIRSVQRARASLVTQIDQIIEVPPVEQSA